MRIRQLIQQRMDSSFNIFNRHGIQIPDSTVKSEYKSIKQYLLDNHQNDECVVIKQQKDYRYFLTMLACMEVGITYIPMKHDYPEDRIRQIKEDANFSLIIDDSKMDEILTYQDKRVTTLKDLSPEKNMYIMFTSGSTGRPKGVIIRRKSLENFFQFIEDSFPNMTKEDKLLQVTEFTFDISLVDVSLFLSRNVTLHFSDFQNNIFRLGHEIETHRINVLNTVPNNLNMFLSEMVCERMDYQCLKYLILAGARFSSGLYQKCHKYFRRDVEIYNYYGPTEATVYSHGKKITFDESLDAIEGNVSIGTVLPGMEAEIIIDGQIAKPHERGELYISGIQVMKGYVNNPTQTQTALVEINGKTYYKSGDLAFKNEKDEYFIVGRADDTIKYRGFRINLLDIDSYMTRLAYIQDSVTIAIPHELTENQTLSFIVLKEQKSVKEIKADLAALLLDYQIPEKFIFVDHYPTNTSGKVCRKTLKEKYLESKVG